MRFQQEQPTVYQKLMNQKHKLIYTTNSRRWMLSLVLVLASVALLLTGNNALAQQGGSPLASGSTYKGTISADVKRVIYSYNAKAGDIITAHVVGLTDGMNPTLDLLSPEQNTLASSTNDPFSPADDPDVRLSYWLQNVGAYLIQVSGTDGDYLLRFTVRQSAVAGTLVPGTPMTFDTSPGVSQVYTFAPDANAGQLLSIASPVQDFHFAAEVYNPVGLRVSSIGGPTVNSATLTLSPGNSAESYEVVISALTSDKQGSVTISLTGSSAVSTAANPTGTPDNAVQPTIVPTDSAATAEANPAQATAQDTPIPPTATDTEVPTVRPPAVAPTNLCSVAPTGTTGVFVRGGPGSAYPPVSSLVQGSILIVNGRSIDSQWYVRVDGTKQWWVSAKVVTTSGPCDNLKVVTPPPVPFPVTRTPVPTPKAK